MEVMIKNSVKNAYEWKHMQDLEFIPEGGRRL
jgi:hypothetical protein